MLTILEVIGGSGHWAIWKEVTSDIGDLHCKASIDHLWEVDMSGVIRITVFNCSIILIGHQTTYVIVKEREH